MRDIRRLHWGCNTITPAGWINSDIKKGPSIELSCDILEGLPLDDGSIEYISSQHALQELQIADQERALRELRRVLKPNGVLRLGLPDLDRAIAAYQRGRREYFQVDAWETLGGNFISHVLWHNYTRTLFTYEFAAELLRKAGFRGVRRVEYRQTASPYPEVVELDNRPEESFYVEAFK
jgi:ubiquinone/menaquinone biosynthesis C-methylase UbiE